MKYAVINRTELNIEKTDFGLVDKKGQTCGFKITFFETTWKQDENLTMWQENNPPFQAQTTATRNEMGYGKTTTMVGGNTLAEVTKKAHARRDATEKRLIKKLG
ncbi:hypothetical protein KAR91_10945 [Candidatus Pacearchaeota archaeon]|nr:hypothetical protein [Candidatus Pacearchaeota archaeon]